MKNVVMNTSILTAVGILAAASMAFARFPSFDRSSKTSADVRIAETGRIRGGPTLQPGEYKVVLNNHNSTTPKIDFYQDGKLVVQVPAKLVDEGKKFDETQLYYDVKDPDTHVLTQMDIRGWKEKVLFGQNNSGARSTN